MAEWPDLPYDVLALAGPIQALRNGARAGALQPLSPGYTPIYGHRD